MYIKETVYVFNNVVGFFKYCSNVELTASKSSTKRTFFKKKILAYFIKKLIKYIKKKYIF